MKFTVLTLFPKMIEGFLSESIIGRAVKSSKIKIELIDLHNWGIGKWKKVDDTPYGGGAGMVLRVDVVATALEDTKKKLKNEGSKIKTILLTPQGKPLSQKTVNRISKEMINDSANLILLCGHYEGFDERIRDYVDEEISIGDYILTGGELAAAVIIDAVSRLLPGVLGRESSYQEESFSMQNKKTECVNLLEYPHFTRPEIHEGKKVPEILKSGNHQKIKEWRREQSIVRTKKRRPDLLA